VTGVNYFQFPVQVCFSSTVPGPVFSVSLFHFQPKKEHFPPLTLTFLLDAARVKVNGRVKSDFVAVNIDGLRYVN